MFANRCKMVVLACMLLCVGVTTQASVEVKTPTGKRVDMLMTVGLKKGVFKRVKGSLYQLSVPKNKVSSIVLFSDRPVRLAFSVNPKRFYQLMRRGPAAFGKNPPNISLVFAKKQVPDAAFEVVSYKMGKVAVSYQLRALGKGKLPAFYRGVVPAIDWTPVKRL